jgi:hypothetical protein
MSGVKKNISEASGLAARAVGILNTAIAREKVYVSTLQDSIDYLERSLKILRELRER